MKLFATIPRKEENLDDQGQREDKKQLNSFQENIMGNFHKKQDSQNSKDQVEREGDDQIKPLYHIKDSHFLLYGQHSFEVEPEKFLIFDFKIFEAEEGKIRYRAHSFQPWNNFYNTPSFYLINTVIEGEIKQLSSLLFEDMNMYAFGFFGKDCV